MPRQARIVFPDIPYHMTQRGNNRQQVFFNPDDYKKYLYFLSTYSQNFSLEVWCYCLMSNHVHLLVLVSASWHLFSVTGSPYTGKRKVRVDVLFFTYMYFYLLCHFCAIMYWHAQTREIALWGDLVSMKARTFRRRENATSAKTTFYASWVQRL